ncbi:MAG: hypothetical protein KKE55_02425 [Candidatus Omnitrophica bacterium]|nr:hypothetical protein [Candidatus Omnitrophota bacterium]MBU1523548.1 hypothetical protein [Candidatus Omnitrophota bacterium]MBU2436536.1 hypothetical protein [Candidatus Omnitrophota bacterium]
MRKNFTLIEIVIVVIILAILVSAAIPIYHNAVESAKERVCVVNQQALLGAVEIYALENDELPADISKLRKEHIEKAWAKVSKQGGWKLKLAYFLVDLDAKGLACAWVKNYLGDVKHLSCPKAPPGGNSYGLNANVANMSQEDYANIDSKTIIIADTDGTTFDPAATTPYSYRHEKYIIGQLTPEKRALGIRKGNIIMAIDDDGNEHVVENVGYGNNNNCHGYCVSHCARGEMIDGGYVVELSDCNDYCGDDDNDFCDND